MNIPKNNGRVFLFLPIYRHGRDAVKEQPYKVWLNDFSTPKWPITKELAIKEDKLVLHMNRSPPDTIFVQMFILWGFNREIFNSEKIIQQRMPMGHKAKVERRIKICMSMCFLFTYIVSYCFFGCVCVCLCVLQEDLSFSALVQLFDPLLSPRCYAIIGLKSYGDRISCWWTYTYADDYNTLLERSWLYTIISAIILEWL